MRRYHTEVLVRSADPDEECYRGEHQFKADVTAASETDARHTVCERAYGNGLIRVRGAT